MDRVKRMLVQYSRGQSIDYTSTKRQRTEYSNHKDRVQSTLVQYSRGQSIDYTSTTQQRIQYRNQQRKQYKVGQHRTENRVVKGKITKTMQTQYQFTSTVPKRTEYRSHLDREYGKLVEHSRERVQKLFVQSIEYTGITQQRTEYRHCIYIVHTENRVQKSHAQSTEYSRQHQGSKKFNFATSTKNPR